MERKFLEGLGLDKDTVEKVMAEHGKTIEQHKQQLTDITTERDGLKTQLDGVAQKLEAFKGVDLDALKQEIETLKGDIAQKDATYQQQIAERDFQAVISSEITAAKGKNPKAIAALLNIDTLKTSKNQKEDVAAALKALRESDAYLFDDSKPGSPTPAKVSSGSQHNVDGGSGAGDDVNTMMNNALKGVMKGE